jgi:cation diffusion facilitator family transporter
VERSAWAAGREAAEGLVAAASLSVLSNTVLAAAKAIVGLSTGALSVLSEALHSVSDLLAAFIAWSAVRVAARPADESHPFGHGKYESLSATVEGLMLVGAAVWIAGEALARLARGPAQHIFPLPGLAVMLAGVVVNALLSTYLLRLARQHHSPALHADGVHLRADVWTSGVVVAGLAAMQVGAPVWVDALLAIVVAAVVIGEGYALVKGGAADLLDGALPPKERQVIEQALGEYKRAYVGYHKLRMRRSGWGRQGDVHLLVCQRLTVGEAHEISERVQEAVRAALPGTDLTVHIEPCDSQECLELLRQGRQPVYCKRLAADTPTPPPGGSGNC